MSQLRIAVTLASHASNAASVYCSLDTISLVALIGGVRRFLRHGVTNAAGTRSRTVSVLTTIRGAGGLTVEQFAKAGRNRTIKVLVNFRVALSKFFKLILFRLRDLLQAGQLLDQIGNRLVGQGRALA